MLLPHGASGKAGEPDWDGACVQADRVITDIAKIAARKLFFIRFFIRLSSFFMWGRISCRMINS